MKILIFALTTFTTPVWSQWTFDYRLDGSPFSSSVLNFPVKYDHKTCLFNFEVNDGQDFNVNIDNTAGCNSDHILVIDDYSSVLPENFQMEVWPDNWYIFGFVNLGECSTISGEPINNDFRKLYVSGNNFEVSVDQGLKTSILNSQTFIRFKTTNGDVFCENGQFFNETFDLIFKGGFE